MRMFYLGQSPGNGRATGIVVLATSCRRPGKSSAGVRSTRRRNSVLRRRVAAMILPLQMDRIPEALGVWLARRRGWKPVGQRVVLKIDESGDPAWFGVEFHGVIQASDADEEGRLVKALIELDRDADYVGDYTRRRLKTVITTPYLRWHGLNRLLVTSAAVHVVDADDFRQANYDRIIALASLRIEENPSNGEPLGCRWPHQRLRVRRRPHIRSDRL